jgi:putative exporter of polyketide antibiotics
MDLNLLIPITLFISLTYAIKAVIDAYTRRRIVESHGSEELVRSLIEGEVSRRRQVSLHWGCVLVALALAFGLIELIGWNEITPGAIALLLGATGLGNFAFYVLERKLKK